MDLIIEACLAMDRSNGSYVIFSTRQTADFFSLQKKLGVAPTGLIDLRVNKCSASIVLPGSKNLKRLSFEGEVALDDDSLFREVTLRGVNSGVSFIDKEIYFNFRTE